MEIVTFKPSKPQQDIFNAYTGSNSNILVSAAPGSGKTTTICQVLKLTPKHKSVCFLAFNKSIVSELLERVPNTVDVSTLHSLGMKALTRHYRGRLNISEFKTMAIAKDLARKGNWNIDKSELDRFMFTIQDLVNVYRMSMAKSLQELGHLANKHEIDLLPDVLERTVEVIEYLNKYNHGIIAVKGDRLIDFTDMVYLPATMNITMPQFDEVFVDECQDLNQAQQIIVDKIIKPGGRMIAVGDKYQSIYSFMGADVESFNKLAQRPNTLCLPLSITYRCAKKIVERANGIYDNIQVAPNAKEGEVRDGSIREAQSGDFVLCRNTAPLVEVFYYFIGQEKKCHIKGKALGKNLITLINKYRNLPLSEALAELKGKLSQTAVELAEKGVKNVTDHPRYVMQEEKLNVIEAVAERYRTTRDVIIALENMFSDDTEQGIILSTIHKSKGLEAERVFIIRRDLMPSKRATQPWQFEQEKNLMYVAFTRAKTSLIFTHDVGEDGVKDYENFDDAEKARLAALEIYS
jgi:DNA helicase-2/ATP-dependent DNA helicase PcrA